MIPGVPHGISSQSIVENNRKLNPIYKQEKNCHFLRGYGLIMKIVIVD